MTHVPQEEKERIVMAIDDLVRSEGLSQEEAAIRVGTTLPKYTYYKYGKKKKERDERNKRLGTNGEARLVEIPVTEPIVESKSLSVVIMNGDSSSIERITANLAKAFGRE